jgi:C4-type Zn-finger protein
VIEIELEEFRNALRRVGVTQARCPMCGQDAWTGTTAGIEETSIPFGKGFIEAVAAACGQCGHVIYHATDPLKRDQNSSR